MTDHEQKQLTHVTPEVAADETGMPVQPASKSKERTNSRQQAKTGWDRKKTSLDKFEQITRILGAIAVAVSAVVAAMQYRESGIKEQRKKSIEFLSEYQAGPLPQAYERLSKGIENVIDADGRLPRGLKGEAFVLAKNQIGRRFMERVRNGDFDYPGDWQSDVEKLVNFYGELNFCVEAKLCNTELIVQYFRTSITEFWHYFSPAIERRRNRYYPQYGRGAETLLSTLGVSE